MQLGKFSIAGKMCPKVVWRGLILVIALLLLMVVTTRWTSWHGVGWQATDDACLHADLTPIAARVSGHVREIPVEDYQRVRGGQLIAQLVDDDYRAPVALAEANQVFAEGATFTQTS